MELIDSLLLQPELLPESISVASLGKNVTYYQIKDNIDIEKIKNEEKAKQEGGHEKPAEHK